MPGLINPYRFGAPPSAEALAWFAAMTVQPDDARKALLAAFMDGLYADGVMAKLDVLYLLIGHDDQATRLNLVSPGTYTLSKVNSPLFTTDGGWKDNAGAGYLDSGFNPTTAGSPKFVLNNASMGVACLDNVASTIASVGQNASARVTPRSSGSTVSVRLNSASAVTGTATATSVGVSAGERSNGTTAEVFRGGSQLSSTANTSSAVQNATFKVLTNDGASFANRTISLAWMGQALGATHQAAIRARYVTFATALGLTPE